MLGETWGDISTNCSWHKYNDWFRIVGPNFNPLYPLSQSKYLKMSMMFLLILMFLYLVKSNLAYICIQYMAKLSSVHISARPFPACIRDGGQLHWTLPQSFNS